MITVAEEIRALVTERPTGMGWLRSRPDRRDYDARHPLVRPVLEALDVADPWALAPRLPTSVDLRPWCSPIHDQGVLGSCTADAAVGIVEYFRRRAGVKQVVGSRLFTYKATRNLMGVCGDTGARIRDALSSLVICGVAPAEFWVYTETDPDFDRDPPWFVHALADPPRGLLYFCHDSCTMAGDRAGVLVSVKALLAAGVPSIFGFWGFGSFDDSDEPGNVPYPCPGDWAEWGHAVVAVGYDDARRITNTFCGTTTTGALLVRNSWGTSWGDEGYGWLPYAYVLDGFAEDFWSMVSADWVATGRFGL